MLKSLIHEKLEAALREAAKDLNNIEVDDCMLESLKVERPKNAGHGDYAVNVSPLARQTRMAPPKIAETVKGVFSNTSGANGNLTTSPFRTSTVAGFVNFTLDDALLAEALVTLATARPAEVGRNTSCAHESILLEYVSANPTGPLHIGHGRWAALGDSLIRIWRHCGAVAVPEFYINDAGVQMMSIANTIRMRSLDILVKQGVLQEIVSEEYPYPGEYVVTLAEEFLKTPENKQLIIDLNEHYLKLKKENAEYGDVEARKTIIEYYLPIMNWAKEKLLAEQKQLLEKLGVTFENWISEYDVLHMDKEGQGNLVDEAFNALKAVDFVYEQDEAWWFRTTAFGDEKDRVVKKQDGAYTYLMPDIAYHKHKFEREDLERDGQPQFNRIINIWGADHHGYIPRMRAALNALGLIKDEFKSVTDKKTEETKIVLDKADPRFEVLLGQLVNLIIDGEKTRMGKRRKMLTLQDVVDEVGVDATRFFMVWKPADTALDFDVDLALKQTSDNPVFYVQYAHARCASILRNAASEQNDTENKTTLPAQFTEAELAKLESSLKPGDLKPLFEQLEDDNAKAALKTLILKLDGFEDIVKDAARTRSPHLIARYSHELAGDFHAFYMLCRILTPDKTLTQARLAVVLALKKVLAQALGLLGVNAPEQM